MQALSRHPNRRPGFRQAPPRGGEEGTTPLVVALDEPDATDPALTGRKAATLAAAAGSGFPVLGGFVITTAGTAALVACGGAGATPAANRSEIDAAWAALSDGGARALVVRSSSPGEDGTTSSMAGQFTSVLDVVGHDAFLAAVDDVIASAGAGGAADVDGRLPPIAVLVQPQVFPRWGGVLFGVDPVSGRADRLALAVAGGGPHGLVGGTVDGARATLSRRGRLLAVEGPGGLGLRRRQRRSLARLAARAGRRFGGPQDIEWALDDERGLLLLQSRPITAVGAVADPSAPVLGPGPVAETFPDALSPLEADLWLHPLREALSEAVLLTGAASRRRVEASPVIVVVGGRAAADLGLLGVAPVRRPLLARLDPRPPALRLRAAWRTGRLRMALPALAADLVRRADDELASVRHVAAMADDALLAVLGGSHQALVSLNAHEILAGMLSPAPSAGAAPGASSAGAALHVVAAARAQGLSDDEIVARHPVVLSLMAPAIGSRPALPDLLVLPSGTGDEGTADPLTVWREALRLRVRWVQELSSVVAGELGRRLVGREVLADAEAVRWLGLDELAAAVTSGRLPHDVDDRRRAPVSAPLPAAFRLSAAGGVVPFDLGSAGGGRGAGGGRAIGRVVHAGTAVPERGDVLVTRTLDPALAPLLPGLGGLVAETGSVLSHLAILAREFGVPTVVGVAEALERFPHGSVVVVDGTAGEVTAVQTADAP